MRSYFSTNSAFYEEMQVFLIISGCDFFGTEEKEHL
jgi:hypothetical protein